MSELQSNMGEEGGASTVVIVVGLILVAVAFFLYLGVRGRDANVENTPYGVEQIELHSDLRSGLEAVADGRTEAAEALFAAVPADDSSYSLALQNLAILQQNTGQLEASHETFSRLVELQPENPVVWVYLGWSDYLQDRAWQAEYATLRALELDPTISRARFDLGLFRLAQGDRLRDALTSYRRAIEHESDRTQIFNALEELLKLTESKADLVDTHYAIALFANVLDRPELEAEYLTNYLELAPEGSQADVGRRRLEELHRASTTSE